MKLLDKEQEVRNKIFKYFGYIEDWRILPFYDSRSSYWKIDDGFVLFGSKHDVENKTGKYYENEIYTQRHLTKLIYKGADYTMIVVDTHTDNNQFLQIFNNSKRLDSSH